MTSPKDSIPLKEYILHFSDKETKSISIEWLDKHIPSLAGPSARWERQDPDVDVSLSISDFEILKKAIDGEIYFLDKLSDTSLDSLYQFADMYLLKLKDTIFVLCEERKGLNIESILRDKFLNGTIKKEDFGIILLI